MVCQLILSVFRGMFFDIAIKVIYFTFFFLDILHVLLYNYLIIITLL